MYATIGLALFVVIFVITRVDAKTIAPPGFLHELKNYASQQGISVALSGDSVTFTCNDNEVSLSLEFIANKYAESESGNEFLYAAVNDLLLLFGVKKLDYELSDIRPILSSRYDSYLYNPKSPTSLFSIHKATQISDEFVIQYDIPGGVLAMHMLTKDNLKNNHNLETINAAAINNLKKVKGDVFTHLGNNVWSSSWNNDYDTSILLLQDRIFQLGIPKEKLVVFMPTRSNLIISSSDESSLTQAAKEALNLLYEHGGLHATPYPLALKCGKWEKFVPKKNTASYALIKEIYYQTKATIYAALANKDPDEHEDVFISSFLRFHDNKNNFTIGSYAFWQTEFEQSRIPRVDALAVVSGDKSQMFFISFSKALQMFPTLIKKVPGPLEYYEFTKPVSFEELHEACGLNIHLSLALDLDDEILNVIDEILNVIKKEEFLFAI